MKALRLIRRHPAATAGAALLLVFALAAALAPLLAPYPVDRRSGPADAPPSGAHLLGTDDGGVDVLSLVMHGGRVSLLVGLCAAVTAVVIGGGVGLAAGYFGRWTDSVLMAITDYFLVVPVVPLMIVVAAIWGSSVTHIVLIIGVLLWTTTARTVRAQVRSIREQVYVRRAETIGAGHLRIIARHVLPQIGALLVANTVLTIAVAIFYETALAFLGLGDPTAVSWGRMIQDAHRSSAISNGYWWTILPPGIAVTLVIFGASLLGRAIEDGTGAGLRPSRLAVRGFRVLPRGEVPPR